MSPEAVMRTFGVLACATTLSLFTTIVAYAAVNVAPLKWDGSFCTANECSSTVAVLNDGQRVGSRFARLGSRVS